MLIKSGRGTGPTTPQQPAKCKVLIPAIPSDEVLHTYLAWYVFFILFEREEKLCQSFYLQANQ